MGIDWTKLAPQAVSSPPAAASAAVAEGGAAGAPPVTEIPAPVKEYIGNLEQQLRQLSGVVNQIGGQFGNMQQNFQVQSEAKTRENLSIWAKDKLHFEDVRQDMAKLIETQVVPLKANGEVDLDTAYERAIYFNPEVRKKVLAEQQQADLAARQQTQDAATTAQQTQVGKARKAAVSLPASSTPGATQGSRAVVAKKPGQKTPVRDSLRQAIQQLRDQ
jgi:DNA-binding TFAR19-related protein (PDSD5 family)